MRRQHWPRFLFWFFSLLIVLPLAGRLCLPWAAVTAANALLPSILGAGFHVDQLDFILHRGFVHLRHGVIRHPQEFGEGVFIAVPEAWVTVRLSSLLHPPIVFEEIIARDGVMNLIINPDGKLNTCVFESKTPKPAAPTAAPPPADDLPSVVLARATGMNISFTFTDRSSGKVPLYLRATGIFARGSSVVIDGAELTVKRFPPARAEVTATLVQDPYPAGLLGVYCRGYPLMNPIPSFLATVQAAGLNLLTMKSLLPDGASKALGGEIVDVSLDFSLTPEELAGEADVVSNRNTRTTLTMSGPPDHPSIDTSSVLYSILVNSSGRLGSFVSRVGGTTWDTAGTLGSGTVGTVGGFGEGIFRTLKGIFTLSPKEFAGGVGQATVGTVYNAGKTVYDTASSAGSGVMNATGWNASDKELQSWLAAMPGRWGAALASARDRLNKQYEQPGEKAGE
jgi:hypothetical protein